MCNRITFKISRRPIHRKSNVSASSISTFKRHPKKIADTRGVNDAEEISKEEIKENIKTLEDAQFTHLHNHSQFSVLQSTINIKDLVKSAADNHMSAVALTDHANMMGAFHFVKEVGGHNKGVRERNETAEKNGASITEQEITPIIGCEFFVCDDHTNKNVKDYGYQIVLLAKNKKGYQNLCKMSSIAYTNGFYYVPRIDRKVIEQYKEDIIVL